MLIELKKRIDVDKHEPVFINPEFVVSICSAYQRLYAGCCVLTTCAREGDEENESYIVKGTPKEVAKSLEFPPHGKD
ncbi:hypothetical protein LCGC14_0483830 [marine sediment metagenome]|uniref:Uncharacterized protein n=1 Tax=marine sediment metagenome TaxID=412755 RepID=A0A0F9SRV1_9ZZZZ